MSWFLAVVLLPLLGLVAPPGPAPERPVDRVLIVSLPAVSWGDLAGVDLPNLDRLFAESALGDLSVTAADVETQASDGYATLGAGARSRGMNDARLAFVAGEAADEETGIEFARRAGIEPPPGSVFNLGAPSLVAVNESLDFGAEIGSLGDSLAGAGLSRAVVGNADRPVSSTESELERLSTVALMGSDGLVSAGAVDPGLLQPDTTAPYGVRYDNEMVASRASDLWARHDVLLVEAADLSRWDTYRDLALDDQRASLLHRALRETDGLVGRLLEDVDPARDAVIVVGPYHRDGPRHLTMAALRAPGVDPGLLRSGTTRRSGFVSLVDVAPTVLSLLGVDRPASMEGRPFEVGSTGGDVDDRRAFLAEADEAARFRDSTIGPVTAGFVVAHCTLWILAALVLTWGSSRLRRAAEIAALSVLAFVPATYLLVLLPVPSWGGVGYWGLLAGLSLAMGWGAGIAGRRHPCDALILVLSASVLLLSIDVVMGAPLQLNSFFGYSPTVAGRFAGLGNLAFAHLAGAAIVLSAMVAQRLGDRRGPLAGAGILLVTIVVDGAPFWGSDVGGVLTLVPAAGVTTWLLYGRRVRAPSVLLWGGAAAVALVVFGLVDLSRPTSGQTHLGRLLEAMVQDGWEPFETVVVRKLDANVSVLTSSGWMLLLPVVFAVVGYVFWRSPGPLRRVREEIPASQAAVAGVLVAMVLGFALNDSGIAVPAVMIGVLSASLVFLVVRLHEADAPRAGPTSVRASEDRPAPRSAPADDRQPVGAASGPSTVP